MDIILDNLQFIIFAVLGILYWIGNKAGSSDETGSASSGQPDANDARRIADIQAEIRRKIAERSGRTAPQQQPARRQQVAQPRQGRVQNQQPAPSFHQPVKEMEKSFHQPAREAPRSAPVSQTSRFDRAAYQRDIDVKMRQVSDLEARAAKVRAQRKASRKQEPDAYSARIPKPVGMNYRQQIRSELRSHAGMKKAFLLKEILGDPLGETGPKG